MRGKIEKRRGSLIEPDCPFCNNVDITTQKGHMMSEVDIKIDVDAIRKNAGLSVREKVTESQTIFGVPIVELEGHKPKDETLFTDKELSFLPLNELQSEDRPEIKIQSMKEILPLADIPIEWLIDNKIEAGGTTSLWIGGPKVGKTTVTRQMALALSRGEPFLGWETKKARVCYVAFEGSDRQFSRHMRAMGALPSDDIYFINDLHADTVEAALATLRAAVLEIKPDMFILDTLGHAIGNVDFNDYGDTKKPLRKYAAFAADNDVHVAFIHHANKGGSTDINKSSLGSSSITGAVDLCVLISKNGTQRYMSTMQREGFELETTSLSFDEDKRIVSLGDTTKKAKKPEGEHVEEAKFLICKHVKVYGESSTQELKDEVDKRNEYIVCALRELVENAVLTFEKSGNGKIYRAGPSFRKYSVI